QSGRYFLCDHTRRRDRSSRELACGRKNHSIAEGHQRITKPMAHGNPDTETTAHAVLDATGRVMAADAIFNMWLGGRTLAELLPTVELSVYDDRAVERVEVFRANQYPTTAQIEWIPLIGEFGSCQLLRIQIAELLTVEDGNYRDAVT